MIKTSKTALLIAAVTSLLLLPVNAAGSGLKRIDDEPMYYSFIYAVSRGKVQAIEAPAPYCPVARVDSETLGTAMSEPVDIYARGDEVYIADKANNCILCTDSEFRLKKSIIEFEYKGETQKFSEPQGVYATDEKIYIADTGNRRIVVLNRDGSCSSVIGTPDSDILSDDLVFLPLKVVADGKGRVYAVVKGVYEGIMDLYEDGSFSGFVGSIPVTPDPLTLLWKSIMTKEQRAKLENFIPVEYTNLTLDKDGFLYTVSLAAGDQNAIRRLNAAGNDILLRNTLGNIPVSGVVSSDSDATSNFVDITVDENGLYYALDNAYGRIFAYDAEGNLLFVFGGKNTGQNGTFQKASSITLVNDTVCVADSESATITLFQRTDYAEKILEGIALYQSDKYVESIDAWNDVLQYNSNFVLAYSKIGKAFYQMGDYGQAMSYFKKSYDQGNYSKAFNRWRKDAFSKNFAYILLGIISAIALIMLIRFGIRKLFEKYPPIKGGAVESLRYSLYVISHPFDGFWDLKYEKRGRTWVSTLLIFLTIIAFAVERGMTGFAIKPIPDRPLDIVYELKFVLVPVALFLVANLSVTTLMDGKGTFGQLYTAVGYALTPLILIKIPVALFSNLFTQNEAMFITLLNAAAYLWVAFLLFAALYCTHEYTASKTVGTIVLTAAAMVIICFICVLFFFLLSELVGFVYTMFCEVRYR